MHTPGKWRPSTSNPRIVVAVQPGGRATDIADVYGGDSRREYVANRDLVAAAPELLEALEAFLDGDSARGFRLGEALRGRLGR